MQAGCYHQPSATVLFLPGSWADDFVDNANNFGFHLVVSPFVSATSWLYKNNSFVFIYLLALNPVEKTFSFIFNNLLASFVTLGFKVFCCNLRLF